MLTTYTQEFTNMWETAFDVTDPAFDCSVNRTHGDASTQLSTINHFLDEDGILGVLVPDVAALNTTNAVSGPGSVGLQAQQCGAEYGRNPNFLLVDVSVSIVHLSKRLLNDVCSSMKPRMAGLSKSLQVLMASNIRQRPLYRPCRLRAKRAAPVRHHPRQTRRAACMAP